MNKILTSNYFVRTPRVYFAKGSSKIILSPSDTLGSDVLKLFQRISSGKKIRSDSHIGSIPLSHILSRTGNTLDIEVTSGPKFKVGKRTFVFSEENDFSLKAIVDLNKGNLASASIEAKKHDPSEQPPPPTTQQSTAILNYLFSQPQIVKDIQISL
jgi:hypothetical protein